MQGDGCRVRFGVNGDQVVIGDVTAIASKVNDHALSRRLQKRVLGNSEYLLQGEKVKLQYFRIE